MSAQLFSILVFIFKLSKVGKEIPLNGFKEQKDVALGLSAMSDVFKYLFAL